MGLLWGVNFLRYLGASLHGDVGVPGDGEGQLHLCLLEGMATLKEGTMATFES